MRLVSFLVRLSLVFVGLIQLRACRLSQEILVDRDFRFRAITEVASLGMLVRESLRLMDFFQAAMSTMTLRIGSSLQMNILFVFMY